MVNPTIYTSCIKQFWATAKAKTVNEEVQIQALVDRKKVIITETSKQKPRKTKKQNTEVSKPSDPTEPMADETENVESIPTHSNDPLLSGEYRLKLNELMELCTNLSQRVLDLENTKTSQAAKITKLKERVKKLERRNKSRTPRLKRLRKVGRTTRIESSEDEGLGAQEDASKQGRKIADLDADAEVEKVVSTTEVTTTNATTTTVDELTLAQTLIEVKAAKPKAVTTAAATTTTVVTRPKSRGVVVKEPSEFTTTTTSQPSQLPQAKDKAKLEEEERLARQKEEEDNLISWDNTQAMMEAYYKSTLQSLELKRSEENHQPKPKRGIKYVDSFVPMNTEVVEGSKSQVEGSKKRTREELESDNLKKQKIYENEEAEADDEAKMKKLMEIVPDDENINREDLETLWKLVKAKHGNTRPEEAHERVLWGDLKVMFEPDIESEVWRNHKVTM
ncbi:hypothetical protein Tco_1062563 [Tanacetum coccineum]